MKEKIMFDELVDDIVARIDPAGHNIDGLTKHYRLKLSILVNQEVEKRIAERMPRERWNYCPSCGAEWEGDSDDFGCWVCGATRSRLTNHGQ